MVFAGLQSPAEICQVAVEVKQVRKIYHPGSRKGQAKIQHINTSVDLTVRFGFGFEFFFGFQYINPQQDKNGRQ